MKITKNIKNLKFQSFIWYYSVIRSFAFFYTIITEKDGFYRLFGGFRRLKQAFVEIEAFFYRQLLIKKTLKYNLENFVNAAIPLLRWSISLINGSFLLKTTT